MRAGFNKWWLLPLGILAASALVALGIAVLEPSFVGRSSADCPGASATDYACYQERYQSLVRDSGVAAAFAELKDEYEKNDFVKASCHPLTHVIGRAAADIYGDIPTTYSRGDDFCGAGYYHGAMEAVAAKIGLDKMLDEADTLCADLSERQKYSPYHRNCVHGLGHGFMFAQENELFGSLRACDELTNGWEREHCYGGVFMQNVMARDDPSHPSEYLKADQPLYPCTDVEDRYKNQCYKRQTPYVLYTQGGAFAKVFELCGEVEDDFRPACYQGVGADAAGQSVHKEGIARIKNKPTVRLCMLGEDYEAQSNCVVGAVKAFTQFHNSDTEAKALCESFDADLRVACLQAAEEYYRSLSA